MIVLENADLLVVCNRMYCFHSKNKVKNADSISVDKSPLIVSNNATNGDSHIYDDKCTDVKYIDDNDDDESTCCCCFRLVYVEFV